MTEVRGFPSDDCGNVMHVVEWNKQNLLNDSAVEALVEELCRGGQATRRTRDEIHLELALQALQDGVALGEIVQLASEQLEQSLITKILAATHGNKAEAARLLKIDYKTLYRKLKKYGGPGAGARSESNSPTAPCPPLVAGHKLPLEAVPSSGS